MSGPNFSLPMLADNYWTFVHKLSGKWGDIIVLISPMLLLFRLLPVHAALVNHLLRILGKS